MSVLMLVLVDVSVLREMNTDYQQCLSSCKQLSQHSSQLDFTSQSTLCAMSVTTDRLLYSCAIEMVCSVNQSVNHKIMCPFL